MLPLWHDVYFFSKNNLPCSNHCGFRPKDSCSNQLFWINHEILSAFDMGIKVFRISVDIPKAFDKSWHDGLIFKLCQNDICSEIINILKNFRSNRKQRVILNNQCLSWADIRAAATQGSLLGTSLFLIYINDLSNDINSKCKFLTEDCSSLHSYFNNWFWSGSTEN